MNNPPGILIRERLGSTSVLRLEGEIDLEVADQLTDALSQFGGGGEPGGDRPRRLRVHRLDGDRAIVRAFNSARASNGETSNGLSLAAPLPAVRRVLDMTLAGLIPIFDDRGDALGAST